MGVTRTIDGNIELVTVTDDAGADFAHTITFAAPSEVSRIKMEKPASGTLVLQSVTASGPTTIVGAASLGATDTTYYSTDQNVCHAVNIESLLLTATSCGAGVKVSITAQSLLSETGRDAG